MLDNFKPSEATNVVDDPGGRVRESSQDESLQTRTSTDYQY